VISATVKPGFLRNSLMMSSVSAIASMEQGTLTTIKVPLMRACNDCSVGPGRSPFLTSFWGTKCAFSAAVRFDGPNDSPALLTVGVIRQSRRFSAFSRRLCCEKWRSIIASYAAIDCNR